MNFFSALFEQDNDHYLKHFYLYSLTRSAIEHERMHKLRCFIMAAWNHVHNAHGSTYHIFCSSQFFIRQSSLLINMLTEVQLNFRFMGDLVGLVHLQFRLLNT